jgi:topoisomerase IV subunit A
VTEKGSLACTVSDLKYSGNKFGKKMIDESDLGAGVHLEIKDAIDDTPSPKPKPRPSQNTGKGPAALDVTEETVNDGKKTIRLNRFDLFDDEED